MLTFTLKHRADGLSVTACYLSCCAGQKNRNTFKGSSTDLQLQAQEASPQNADCITFISTVFSAMYIDNKDMFTVQCRFLIDTNKDAPEGESAAYSMILLRISMLVTCLKHMS